MKIKLQGEIYKIFDGMTIGREPKNFLIVDPEYVSVSRKHAMFQIKEGEFYIIDTNSSFGTYVNGEKVGVPRELKPGDKIILGKGKTALELEVLEGEIANVKENEK